MAITRMMTSASITITMGTDTITARKAGSKAASENTYNTYIFY